MFTIPKFVLDISSHGQILQSQGKNNKKKSIWIETKWNEKQRFNTLNFHASALLVLRYLPLAENIFQTQALASTSRETTSFLL